MTEMRVVTEGLHFPEGPVAMPDGSVVVVEIQSGDLTRVLPDGSKETVAHCGGGPNGAAAKLGLKRTTLIAKMQKLGISRPVQKQQDVDLLGREHPRWDWLTK